MLFSLYHNQKSILVALVKDIGKPGKGRNQCTYNLEADNYLYPFFILPSLFNTRQ